MDWTKKRAWHQVLWKRNVKTRKLGKAFKIIKCLHEISKAIDKLHYLYYYFFFLHFWLILLIYYSFRLFSVASSEFKKEQQPFSKVSIMSCQIKCVFCATWDWRLSKLLGVLNQITPPLLADTAAYLSVWVWFIWSRS